MVAFLYQLLKRTPAPTPVPSTLPMRGGKRPSASRWPGRAQRIAPAPRLNPGRSLHNRPRQRRLDGSCNHVGDLPPSRIQRVRLAYCIQSLHHHGCGGLTGQARRLSGSRSCPFHTPVMSIPPIRCPVPEQNSLGEDMGLQRHSQHLLPQLRVSPDHAFCIQLQRSHDSRPRFQN